MTATRRPVPAAQSSTYRLSDEHRQAILSGSESARIRKQIQEQRENFRAKNNGFEFSEQTKP